MSVIERRKGLPVALGILYIHAARAAGLQACGLFAPGHFLLKIAVKRSEALIDPFNAQTAIDRERFTAPAYAEVPSPGEPDPFEPVSDTEVLLRLQNNVRSRALERRDMARAIEIGKRMLMLAPKRGALWLELGHLQERAGSLSAARQSYENCLKVAPQGDSFHNEALVSLSTLKRRLN
jgi:regulator of sirC expression with transglutaminase-like and TPR domain